MMLELKINHINYILLLLLRLVNLLPSRISGKIYYVLFKHPIRNKKKNYLRLNNYKPIIEYIYVAQKKCFIYKIGDNTGEKILCVHGWSSFASCFYNQVNEIKKSGYQIILIDLPSHGMSEGKYTDIEESAEAISITIKKYNIKYAIAHSYGGLATAYAVMKYNLILEKLVLLNTPADFKVLTDVFSKILSIRQKVKKELCRNIERHFDYLNQNIWEKFSTKNNIKNIATLIINDKNDKIIDYHQAEILENSLNNSKKILIKGSGHNGILKNRKTIIQVLTFLDRGLHYD